VFSTTYSSLPSSLKTFAQACRISSTDDPEIAVTGFRIPRHSAKPGRSCLRSRSQRSSHFPTIAALGRPHRCCCSGCLYPSPISKAFLESSNSELFTSWPTRHPITHCSPTTSCSHCCPTADHHRHRPHPQPCHSPLLSDSFCSCSFFSFSFSCPLNRRSLSHRPTRPTAFAIAVG